MRKNLADRNWSKNKNSFRWDPYKIHRNIFYVPIVKIVKCEKRYVINDYFRENRETFDRHVAMS